MAKHILDGAEGFIRRSDFFHVDPRVIAVDNGWNARTDFSGQEELKNSIISEGVKVPILVKKDDAGRLHLVDGERRLRATLEAISEGHEIVSIPAQVAQKGVSEVELLFDSITRNDSKPFNPFEEAVVYRRFINWGITEAEIARRRGKSVQHIRDRIQLNNASSAVREAVTSGQMTLTQAISVSKDSSISSQAEKATASKRPHTMTNMVVRCTPAGVKYSGVGKGIEIEPLSALLNDANFMQSVEDNGFDSSTITIKIQKKAEASSSAPPPAPPSSEGPAQNGNGLADGPTGSRVLPGDSDSTVSKTSGNVSR